MSYQLRDQQLKRLQNRVRQLQEENRLLRNPQSSKKRGISYSCTCPCHGQPYCEIHNPQPSQTLNYHPQLQIYDHELIELASKNQKLQRQANKYQQMIKSDLVDFIRQSNIIGQCSFKQKYTNALWYPKRYKSSLVRR